jgi:iron complex outermembrane receptor protein
MQNAPARKLLVSAILLASTSGAFAQGDSSLMLEEIIVTAQKRSQSVQDIPIAITAFDKATIERQRINRVTDISLYAPNVEIIDTPTNTTAATIAIRGASQINPAITWENSVGLYLDGVFIGKNLGAVFDVVELERVEVLRGPQGTLYGKNTVGAPST